MARVPATNHVVDPWPSIVGTAIHAWMADAFTAANERYGLRWVAEHRVTPHPDHPGTADLYDALEQAVVDHKGVHVDTPIATPTGWTTIGNLAVGDQVFGADGLSSDVTRVYPVQQRTCYRVRFTDGTDLITDDIQELPFVRVVGRHLYPALMPVAEAADQVWLRQARPYRQLRLYNGAPLDLPERDLPVHPYVLGCWLGDGGVNGGTIVQPNDHELFEHISDCGYKVGPPIGQRKTTRTVYGLTTQLQRIGLQWAAENNSGRYITGSKRIPAMYLRASRHQRLALLQGLMDTDGSWNRKRRQAVFISTNKQLAESAAELVTSLGWKARIYPLVAKGFGLTVQAYRVVFVPFGRNPFRLDHKASQVRIDGTVRARYRTIASIEPTVSVPTRCIDVDSPDHLYLCGRHMIPVHNCLSESSMAKVRKQPPQHYVVQLLLYGRGYRLLGLPVRRVVLAAWPRTGSSVDGLYIWDHPITPADDALIESVFARTAIRARLADQVRDGRLAINAVPATPDPDSCFWCPLYRPQSARDGGPGCSGAAQIGTTSTAP
jgi:hypothetical protein